MPSRNRGHGRATTRLAVALLAAAGLATGCAGPAPAPVPTTVAPSGPSAEELLAEATAEAKASAEASDAQITLLPGVADAVVRIAPATADKPFPAVTFVTFAAGTPVDQLRPGVTTILEVLGASGLALDHVELIVDRAGRIDEATWTGEGAGPNLAQEAQLWVDLIELTADARSINLTHEGLDPLQIRAYGLEYDRELPTSAVYSGLVDACVAAGIDPATVHLETEWHFHMWSSRSTPIPTGLIIAAEQVDILDYVDIAGITRSDNHTTASFSAHEGVTLTAFQQLALLGPFDHVGLLTDDLTVTLLTNEMEEITLWPQTAPA